MKRFAWIVVLALCLVPALAAEEQISMGSYPALKPWKKITDAHNSWQTMREWIPADQSENAISDIVTQQAFSNIPGADPSAFVTRFLKDFAGKCESARVNGPTARMENGYRVAYGQVYCVNHKAAHLNVDIFIKAISGAKALYSVQREFRAPATPGAQPGVAVFAANQADAMPQRMQATLAADRYLTEGVKLCPGTDGCKGGLP